MKTYCVYHRDLDGIMAASMVSAVECVDVYVATLERSLVPKGLDVGDRIFYVDLLPSDDILDQLSSNEVVVIDHHESERSRILSYLEARGSALSGEWAASEGFVRTVGNLHGKLTVCFDSSQCAARVAESFFFPNKAKKAEAGLDWVRIEAMLHATNYYDLWLWDGKQTEPKIRALAAALIQKAEMQFDEEKAPVYFIFWGTTTSVEELVSTGMILVEQEQRYVADVVSRAHEGWIGDCPVVACNCPRLGGITNWVADDLLKKYPDVLCVTYSRGANGVWTYSVRSTRGGKSSIPLCASFGGGGHPSAGGFRSENLVVEARKWH